MLMDALDPVVKAALIARKANHSASHIRLYTTYQPGGTGERNLVLSNLQNPQVIHDAVAGVAALRDGKVVPTVSRFWHELAGSHGFGRRPNFRPSP